MVTKCHAYDVIIPMKIENNNCRIASRSLHKIQMILKRKHNIQFRREQKVFIIYSPFTKLSTHIGSTAFPYGCMELITL